jgi:secreted PhoX family phosphatase
MAELSRRQLLRLGGVAAGGAAVGLASWQGLDRLLEDPSDASDPDGLIDLPPGFRYRVLSDEDSTLPGGAPVPGDFDGMAAYRGPRDTVLLMRNHELTGTEGPAVVGRNPYDPDEPGGTTALVVGPDRTKIDEFVTSSGTRTNCAGGRTPWGTWLTCEESWEDGHGYVFEVMPEDPENGLSKTPIGAMGSFSHEAVGIDPRSGIVYMTEDALGGYGGELPSGEPPASFLYRYVPRDLSRRPGALYNGGRLQALAIDEPARQRGGGLEPASRVATIWKDVDPTRAHDEALATGAARFRRLEGACFRGGAFWFADTSGGESRLGRIYRYLPAGQRLELFYEARVVEQMRGPDNVVVSPWGDLWFVEDLLDENRVMGITPKGRVYRFATCRLPGAPLAGPTFSPDGRTFFVNIQIPPVTLAIWGPFARRDAGGGFRMAAAQPPRDLAPGVPEALTETIQRGGVTALEAAAWDRLVPGLS